MRLEEARWVRRIIDEKRAELSPLLNVGSSTAHFREIENPHIQENIFQPLKDYGVRVEHLDMKRDEGVDLVGDLTNPTFLAELKKKKFQSVFCTNLLEHVPNPAEVCRAMEQAVVSGGWIIVTGPNLYKYHPDPMDTKFRPSVEEVASLFPSSKLIAGEIIVSNGSHFQSIRRRPRSLLTFLVKIVLPFYQFSHWKKRISDVPNFFRKYRSYCVLLQRQ